MGAGSWDGIGDESSLIAAYMVVGKFVASVYTSIHEEFSYLQL